MERTDEQASRKRVVNYTAALKYINEQGLPLTEGALRSRISRGTVPVEGSRPAPGGRELMFDLDKLDEWLAGRWRKEAR